MLRNAGHRRQSPKKGDGTLLAERVSRKYDRLTAAQRRLAEYVVENRRPAAFMTARQLATVTGLSDAAVVRFAQALGFEGYPQLRAALREEVLSRTGALGVADASDEPTSTSALVQRAFRLDRELVESTARLNDGQMYERVVQQLCAARRVWVTGHGTSYPLAAYLAMTLNRALGNAEVVTVGVGDLSDRLRSITREDVVVGIGYVRYLPYTVDVLRIARERGAHVVAITDKPSSPLARLADEPLLVARDGISFHWSQVGTMAVANAIVVAVAMRDTERIRSLLRDSDELWRRQGLWEGAGDSPAPGSTAAPASTP